MAAATAAPLWVSLGPDIQCPKTCDAQILKSALILVEQASDILAFLN
jgi:hypothetical protein